MGFPFHIGYSRFGCFFNVVSAGLQEPKLKRVIDGAVESYPMLHHIVIEFFNFGNLVGFEGDVSAEYFTMVGLDLGLLVG